MYRPVKVHVPEKVHEKLKSRLADDKMMPVKIDLMNENDHVLLLTPGQIIKMENAKKAGKKSVALRFSRKQVHANVQHEGGFLGMLAAMAAKVLPTLLPGLASGVIGGLAEKAISGSGLYLGKRGRGVSRIHLVDGGGLYLSPIFHPEEEDYDGLYMTHDDKIYKGSGLILGKNSPFRNIPILGWLL